LAQFKNEIFLTFPDSIKNALQLIANELNPKKIILFGSRARKDHRPNSDFDFCVVEALNDAHKRSEVRLSIEDEAISLYKIDLLFYEELNKEYIDNIKREGVLIYE